MKLVSRHHFIFRLLSVFVLLGLVFSWPAGGALAAGDLRGALQSDGPSEGKELAQGQVSEGLPTDQIIIKFKPKVEDFRASPQSMEGMMAFLSARAGAELQYVRPMAGEADVLKLDALLPEARVSEIAQRLMALPEVEFAEPDAFMQAGLTPNDTQYGSQWHYWGTYGLDLPAAWDMSTGSAAITVAVIDTGIINHPDLAGRTVAGYDFISDITVANDGNGRDNNPTDPGDWCGSSPSSWHGTHVAGTIGAASNNSVGVAGVNWVSKILPVRVLGKCGGYLSDIADGMRWAAGLYVPGVPANPKPAKVLNLSLGGYGACGATYQTAVNAINARNVNIVVAAGNSSALASNYRPGNCVGVITVAASNSGGDQPYFSNYGAAIEISAPGEDILSTANNGATTLGAYSYLYKDGTSMAAPHVAGLVSLMLSVNPSLTRAQVLSILQSTAKDFAPGAWCLTGNYCGAGIIDADNALKVAKFSSWAGSVKVTSNQGLVTVGRPHVGAEVASYNGNYAPSNVSYAPMLFKDAFGGSYDSALYVQNDASTSENIDIDFYDSDGTFRCTHSDSLPPYVSKGYWLPSIGCLPAGWVGSALVVGDHGTLTVARSHVGSEVMTYNGFNTGTTTAYAPMLFKNAFGGSYNSALYVQNTHPSLQANITIQYYDNAGNLTCTDNDVLDSRQSKGYWQPSVVCDTGSLPDGWAGGAVITSDRDIVSVVRPHVGTQVTTYSASNFLSTGMLIPMLFKNAFGGSYDAAFYLQNTSASSANITISFYDSDGNLTHSMPDTLGAHASKGYWLPDIASLPNGWAGGAVVLSSQNIVGVGRPHVGSQVTTYAGSNYSIIGTQYLPMVFRDAFGGSYDAALYLQNTHSANTANVTLEFYDDGGVLLCTVTDSILPRATKGYWVPGVVCDP